mgnify:CR=1 FL=1
MESANLNGVAGRYPMLELIKRKLFKIIFWMFVLIAVPFSILMLVGSQRFEYQAEVKLEATAEAIFPYLHDPDKVTLWQNGVLELKTDGNNFNRPGDTATLRLQGTSGKNSNHAFGMVIKDIFPSTHLITESEADIFKSQSTWELKTFADHSIVRHKVACFYSGVGRFLAPFMTDEAERQMREDLWKLKEVVEAEQGDS